MSTIVEGAGSWILPDLLELSGKQARFERICMQAMRERREDLRDGIGLLGEKWQHQIIKRYLSEDPADHEVRFADTRFVSDVRVGDRIFEVQTGSFAPMKRKLERYFADPAVHITVVHPFPAVRYLSWINAKTGEIAPRRRVAGKRAPIRLLPELYPLIPLLSYFTQGRLSFRLLLLEVQDFKLLDGRTESRKVGASRIERIPTGLLQELELCTPADLAALLPDDLPEPATVAELSRATGLRGLDAYSAVRVLLAVGVLADAGKKGRGMAVRRLL